MFATLFFAIFYQKNFVQTLQVGGVLESSGTPLNDGHRDFEDPRLSNSRKTSEQILMTPTVIMCYKCTLII